MVKVKNIPLQKRKSCPEMTVYGQKDFENYCKKSCFIFSNNLFIINVEFVFFLKIILRNRKRQYLKDEKNISMKSDVAF